jgi:ArsR family transcriptional regulator
MCAIPHMNNARTTRPADCAAAFAALADETRLRMLRLLIARKTLCVCEVMDALGISPTRASRNLGLLGSAGFLRRTRRGKWMYYSVTRRPDLQPLLALVRRRVPAVPARRRPECEER